MTDGPTYDPSPAAVAFAGGDLARSITPDGQAMNQSWSEPERAETVPKGRAAQGQGFGADAPENGPSQVGGYGMETPHSQLDSQPHRGSDPAFGEEARYGASARYDENHDAKTDMPEAKTRPGHDGAQARYANAGDVVNGPTGHDEQQLSRELTKRSLTAQLSLS